MQSVNIFEAKTNLSKLLESIESGRENEIVIARNGKPVARLVSLSPLPVDKRIGVAKGKFNVPESIDADNDSIHKLFTGVHE
ncbi:MAG: type II toxin-antitoxin system prevent-host-death family antitoxin [Thermodesulfovibrionia bacterium]|nr:type II toxin-antitoxin system prevent-host-death family antitoxin [Thermodesulfovibrionia bacterium]